MPRVKIDYIVSFSSEDPEHPASNLLAWDISRNKWLCNKGEPSCSTVLQLTKAVKISAVHIGAHHAALVEVLVGRSENPNDPFQVLVPSSVFLSPTESRRDQNVERVRTFSADHLAEPARQLRWDRVRVVCSQPYNKHCKYGLSFVHIFEPEGKDVGTAVPGRLLALDTYSYDDDEFKPGELFNKYLQKPAQDDNTPTTSTDAQIRQATSQALKNISDTSTKLMKTPIMKENKHDTSKKQNTKEIVDRKRDTLIYTDDDEQPHAKIDKVVHKHKDERDKEASKNKEHRESGKNKRPENNPPLTNKNEKLNKYSSDSRQIKKDEKSSKTAQSSSDNDRNRKRRHSDGNSDTASDDPMAGPGSSRPPLVLEGVVFVLSGYQNPERAELRALALALGARCHPAWGPACTHLVCAFPNTPKLKQVRGAAGGAAAVVVTGAWVRACADARRRLPWRWFATEPRHRRAPPADFAPASPRPPLSEGDTDDEIEKVIREQKKRRVDDGAPGGGPPRLGDVEFVCDEQAQAGISVQDSGSDTEREPSPSLSPAPEAGRRSGGLPDFFEGLTFFIDKEAGFDSDLLARYIRAYGGELLQASQVEEGSEVDHVVRGVRAEWIWRCHAARALLPHAPFALA